MAVLKCICSAVGLLMGKFDWGVRYIIIFLYVQFLIRLAAVSNRGKKVRTVASPAVRSVYKSRDTWICVQNEPEYTICVIFITRSYYKALGLILCGLMWHIRHNYNRLDDTNVSLQVTARCQRWARLVPWWQPVKIPWWYERLRDQNCFVFCKTYWKWKRVMGFTLWCCLQAKFNFVFESNFWLVSSFWKLLFPFDWDFCGEYRQPIAQVGGA